MSLFFLEHPLISVQPLINVYIGNFGQIYQSKSYVIKVYVTNKAYFDIIGKKIKEACKELSENLDFRSKNVLFINVFKREKF